MDGKSVIIFAAGAALGGLATWVVTKSHYEKVCQQEIERRWKKISGNSSHTVKVTVEEDPVAEEMHDRNEDLVRKTATYMNMARDYTSCYGKKDDIFEAEAVEREYPTENRFRPPYEIEAEEAGYGESLNTVTYYTKDEVLADDITSEALSIADTIGVEGLKLRLESNEEAIYIRNEKIGLDYEVLIKDGSYEEEMREINGLSDDE